MTKKEMVSEICFEDLKSPWLVTILQTYVQTDGCNCGPITCLKVMERIYGFLKAGSIEIVGESNEGYRPAVVDCFNQCVTKYKNT